ncbi:MAG: anthranilate phosphoribosyltransferase [Chloroflexi bacterium]|nr:anthranilate phosphoribosyltransferase [Chloroflexota bacterium]
MAQIREAISAITAGRSLTQAEAAAVMEEIMSGEATPAQLGAFLVGLRMKGETVEEIAGLASVMRAKATPVPYTGLLVDTCGTGGDNAGTFNVSTTAAIVTAAAGVPVAKHGNRAMSSHCGSADVLEALGVRIDLPAEGVGRCLREVGIGFMFAQRFHPSMKHAAGPRREIGVRTVFNILGPLTNPAGARRQLLGVPDPAVAAKMARALQLLGSERAIVVSGEDGVDELSISGATVVFEVDGEIRESRVRPEQFGLSLAPLASIAGGTAAENAELTRQVLDGALGPRRDIVLLNAAAALVAGGKVLSIPEGIALAAATIDSGAARRKLADFVNCSRSIDA